MNSTSVRLHRWDEIALEKVTEMISRKLITGEREMIAHDITRARRDKVVDQAAAAFILQGVLDALSRQKPAP